MADPEPTADSYELAAAELVANANVPPFRMDSDDFVVGAGVIALIKDGRGNVGMYVRFSEDLNWVERLGMTTAMAGVELESEVRSYLRDD